MTIETRNVCVISAAHVREATWIEYHAKPLEDWPIMGAPVGPDMLYLHAAEALEGVPADLAACVTWARGAGFDYLMIDRDVDPTDDGTGLPDYVTPVEDPAEIRAQRDALDRLVRDLIGEVRAYDLEHITHAENDPRPDRPPEGDDYNELAGIVEAYEPIRARIMDGR